MKLKNIFLSLFALVVITTSCEKEDFSGPDKVNPGQETGLPAAIMLNANANAELETRSGDESANKLDPNVGQTLYVFVFDATGNILGKGTSESSTTEKAEKVFKVINGQGFKLSPWDDADKIKADIEKSGPSDVIVTGTGIKSGVKVDVVLIANPSSAMKSSFDGITNLNGLNALTTDLTTQASLYKNNESSRPSTSCQRFTLDKLERGINYIGANKYSNLHGESSPDWWHNSLSTNAALPLYRLVSEINLKQIACGDKCNYLFTGAYIKAGTYSEISGLFPDALISLPTAVATESNFEDWCKKINNSLPTPGSNALLGGKECVITANMSQTVLGTTAAYAFEGATPAEGGPVLVLTGYFSSKASTSEEIEKVDRPINYEIPIENFRRNHIYDVYVTISGEEADPTPSVTIKVKSMSYVKLDFEIGD